MQLVASNDAIQNSLTNLLDLPQCSEMPALTFFYYDRATISSIAPSGGAHGTQACTRPRRPLG